MVVATTLKGLKVNIKVTPQAQDDYLDFGEDSGGVGAYYNTTGLRSNDGAANAASETDVQNNISTLVSNTAPNGDSSFGVSGFTAAFPNGVSSGDVTQTSAVVWTRAVETGHLTFQIATDASFHHAVKIKHVTVTDPMVPVKVEFDNLKPGEEYFYRAIDASGDVVEGRFETAAELGTHEGFHFGIVADQRSELAPFVSIRNAPAANLDLVIKLGDTVYADQPAPPAGTLQEFRLEHNDVYSSHSGFNILAELQATTPILSMIDDHEVVDNFAGGAHPSSDPRFTGQSGDFINETPLYANGLQAFSEYNAIENRTYSGTGEDRFDGAPDLYRYNTYGSDAAIIMVDARSFRDTELPTPTDPLSPSQISQFLFGSFDPTRTMLGNVQLDRLDQDLLDARDNGVTWKFVMLPEPIQNFGPVIEPGDRYEGYAAERNALLKFIDDNHIENVVFVSSDTHWTSVNNLTYQNSLGGPQIASSAFEVNTLAAASNPIAPLVPLTAAALGFITADQLAFYNSLPNLPDPTDSIIPNDKDDFVEQLLDQYMTQLGNDPIGLDHNLAIADGKIDATLLQGDYFVGHDFGWTDFNIDATTSDLLVTTYGVPAYTAADLSGNPAAVLALNPTIVSQFEVTPTSDSIIGTARNDHLDGTSEADVILGAAGNDVLQGGGGDDYLDGGKGNDLVYGGAGEDRIFGRDGNDRLFGHDGDDHIVGGAGADTIDGGNGNDVITGGARVDMLTGGTGADTFRFTDTADSGVGAGNRDIITDFTVGTDKIDLSMIDAKLQSGPGSSGDQAFLYGGQNGDVVANGVTWIQSGSDTLVQVDVNGDTTADLQIQLTGLKTLAAFDFIL